MKKGELCIAHSNGGMWFELGEQVECHNEKDKKTKT